MPSKYQEIGFTPAVQAAQEQMGSRGAYAARAETAKPHDALTEAEAQFIAARDSFYMATVSETGWPYLQHRGGPKGFLKVLDERTLGFADFAGNRQYISLGNLKGEARASLFLMDYPNQRRLKIFARVRPVALGADDDLTQRLAVPGYKARIERGFLIALEAFDWNCPQHITPRFTMEDLEAGLGPVRDRLEQLEAENAKLKAELAAART